MKNYKVTLADYRDYLVFLRRNIHTILPLYDEGNEFIDINVTEVLDDVIYVKEVIKELPDGYWYVKTLNTLLALKDEVKKEDNLKIVRRKVLNTTKLISKEIDKLNKELR